MKYTKIEQYIKIKAIDDKNYLGNFKISIKYDLAIDYLSDDDFVEDVTDYEDLSDDVGGDKYD